MKVWVQCVLGTVGLRRLIKVKHRLELPLASEPTLFALLQCTEGFVWLGLDGYLSAQTVHNTRLWRA